MPQELRNLDAREVSLVDRPAIRRRFLFTKAEGGPIGGEPRVSDGAGVPQEVLDVLTVPADGEDAAVAKAQVPAKASGAAVGLLRIAKAWAPDLPAPALLSLLESAGYTVAVKAARPAGGEPDDEPEDEDEDDREAMKEMSDEEKAAYRKARKARTEARKRRGVGKSAGGSYAVPVKKADGTWDLSRVPAELHQVVKAAWDAQETATHERNLRLTREYVEKAAGYTNLPVNPADFGPVLRELAEKAPEAAAKMEGVLKAADEALAAGGLFVEAGAAGTGRGGGTSAWDEIVSKAAALVQKDSSLTPEQARLRIMEQEPALYGRHRREQGYA